MGESGSTTLSIFFGGGREKRAVRLSSALINAWILNRESDICVCGYGIKAIWTLIQINYAVWKDRSNYHFKILGSKWKYTRESYE